jgi:hypothetical protein
MEGEEEGSCFRLNEAIFCPRYFRTVLSGHTAGQLIQDKIVSAKNNAYQLKMRSLIRS